MVRQLLSQERDVDMSKAIRTAVLELDRIQVAMETVRLGMGLDKLDHHYIIFTANKTDIF